MPSLLEIVVMIMSFLSWTKWLTLGSTALILFWVMTKLLGSRRKRKAEKLRDDRFSIGFFHPYCNAGGGGERVLWVAVRFMLERYPNLRYIIYTGDIDVSAQRILQNAKARFNIDIPYGSVEFVYLNRRSWVEAYKYPHFTLLGQSLGSAFLGLEALDKFVPDIFVDTMGYAFTLPIFKLLGNANVACYVHYPTISTDMLDRVANRTLAHNNDGVVAKSSFLSTIKLYYYKLFALIYSWAGRFSDVIMVNSSWTQGHITSLWQCPVKTFKVFPPCDVEDFNRIQPKSHDTDSLIKVLSVAQFRPEKDHSLQLRSLGDLKKLVDSTLWKRIRLILIGSCRNSEDSMRVEELKRLSKKLGIEETVEFKTNVAFDELKEEMSEGMIGIHTMWNEHFGIGVVECMAAGLIMLANRSGGPMMDIVDETEETRTGFLATTSEEYAKALAKIISMNSRERAVISSRARLSVDRFSDEQFTENFLNSIKPLLPLA